MSKVTYIPAAPGFFTHYVDATPGDEVFIETSPVIAWVINPDRDPGNPEVSPVTALGDRDLHHMLMTPKGTVFDYAADTWFKNLDEAIAARADTTLRENAKGLA